MSSGFIKTKDGTDIFFKDWGPREAQPIVFHHGWPLSSDDWDAQMLFFLSKGYRVVAHDRRGHGRSSHPRDLTPARDSPFEGQNASVTVLANPRPPSAGAVRRGGPRARPRAALVKSFLENRSFRTRCSSGT